MPLFVDLAVGEGVRIDGTNIWLLKTIAEDGAAARFFDPLGREVVLEADVPFRAAPGLKLWLSPVGGSAERVRLVLDAYIPLIHRYPPRTGGPAPKRLPAAGGEGSAP